MLPTNMRKALLTALMSAYPDQLGGQGPSNPAGPLGNIGGASSYSGGFWQGQDPAQRWADFMKELGPGVSVSSGYRSPEEQAAIWNRTSPERRGTWVAAPGKSYHNRRIGGLPAAQDLRFASGDVRQRYSNLAPKYGFYQPMSWENWHWEPYETRSTRGR